MFKDRLEQTFLVLTDAESTNIEATEQTENPRGGHANHGGHSCFHIYSYKRVNRQNYNLLI
jgi:hypothetical protein